MMYSYLNSQQAACIRQPHSPSLPLDNLELTLPRSLYAGLGPFRGQGGLSEVVRPGRQMHSQFELDAMLLTKGISIADLGYERPQWIAANSGELILHAALE